MTQYVRGLTTAYKEYWMNLIGTEIIPVKDGKPKLKLKDRILGRKEKAYYILDVETLDPSTRANLVNRLMSQYEITERAAESWLKEFIIPARYVERIERDDNTCSVCGTIIPEKGIKFCPKCGSRLHIEQTVEKIVAEKPVVSSESEISSESGNLETVQVVREEAISVTTEDIAVKAQEFKMVWSKVLLFLEEMHRTFDLDSITFKDGKAVPAFSTTKKKRTQHTVPV
jgi:uncharacterized Zn finger protein (UPF0148 family)